MDQIDPELPSQVRLGLPRDPAIKIDQEKKELTPNRGETIAKFYFSLSNVSLSDVTIVRVTPSCGCTTPKLPAQPWKIKPGERGELILDVDLTGKAGVLLKTARIVTETGYASVTMQINLGSVDSAKMRENNMRQALIDRQSVFQGACISCHVPERTLYGQTLFAKGCAICHESENRATMVPDLAKFGVTATADGWRAMIVAGRPGTLMPGFSKDMDGPLDREQIDSLVKYLLTVFHSSTPTAN